MGGIFKLFGVLLFSASVYANSITGGTGAIISSISPIVVSGIQSVANRDIARISSAAEIKMTEINADVAKYKIDAESFIAKTNMLTTAYINDIQNQGETTRLSMILSMLRETNEKHFEIELKKLELEKELLTTKIEFEKAQADAMYKLAKMKLQLEFMKDDLRGIFERVNSQQNLKGNPLLGNKESNPAKLVNSISESSDMKRTILKENPSPSLLRLLRQNNIVKGSSVGFLSKIQPKKKPILESDLSSFIRHGVVSTSFETKTHSPR